MILTLVMPASAASPVKVELGTTAAFAVLSGSAITNTGTTTIDGDAGGNIGMSPGTEFIGQASVTLSGTANIADAAASVAKDDLVTAYNDAAGRTPTTAIAADLGGMTLTAGVYNSASSIGINGNLILDAQGDPEAVFIFQAGSTLITSAGSHIELINGARYCRVFWQVGSSATLGTNSVFRGHIFALTSITVTTGAMVQGQLLALNGAVTLDTNTITNGFCAVINTSPSPSPPPSQINNPPIINIIKTPDPLFLFVGGGSVTYTYEVTNPGMVVLNDVSVTDDKLSPVIYVSGDVNSDKLLQPGETWIYTGTTNLSVTTSNTATAKGSANGTAATDIAIATVTVGPTVVATVNGGQLPATATPWYTVLLIGACLLIFAVVGFKIRKSHE